jgi:hypothetical protein
MEGLIANITLVSFFSVVRELVILVVALLMETFATEFADEGLIVGVNACVSI